MQWNITKLDTYPEYEGLEKVVFTAYWVITDSVDGYSGKLYGATGISPITDGDFIPYEELTEEQVIAWVKAALGEQAVAGYETNVSNQIQDQMNPAAVTPALPWA